MKKNGQSGFTFIELLIVIALLAALVGLILPGMNADKTSALDDVCGYNQAGTIRTVLQYEDYYSALPDQFHTGLVDPATDDDSTGYAAADYEWVQAGPMPQATRDNLAAVDSVTQLTTNQTASLIAAGVNGLAYGDGYNITTLSNNNPVVITPVGSAGAAAAGTGWGSDGADFTVKFRTLDVAKQADQGLGGAGEIIALFVTPTMDWEANKTLVEDSYAADVNMDLQIDLEGRCPIPPAEESFTYYMAYVKAFNDGVTPAKLVAVSCPECGLINP
jgi:prepilin-type N-terminal cleavage/methylation domain-containing protein